MSEDSKKTLMVDDTAYETNFTKKFINRKTYEQPDPKKLKAFIPGTIPHIYVSDGQKVNKGQQLLILEAMKMKNDVRSPHDGIVKKIHISKGQMVGKGQLLIEFE